MRAPPSQAPPRHLPRLTSSKKDGKPYQRRADVEAEIVRVLALPRGDWVEMAKGGQDRLSSEALVFLIRQVRHAERDLFGQLVEQLSHRINKIAGRWARGFDEQTTEELVLKVGLKVIEHVLAEAPSRQTEFLEVAFGMAVKRRTINTVAKRKGYPLPLSAWKANEKEGGEPTNLAREEGPDPQEVLTDLEEKARTRDLVSKARAAVADSRHLEALILRKVYGWPLYDKDPTKPTLAARFGKSPRQIQNWIDDALKAMRAAIGETR